MENESKASLYIHIVHDRPRHNNDRPRQCMSGGKKGLNNDRQKSTTLDAIIVISRIDRCENKNIDVNMFI